MKKNKRLMKKNKLPNLMPGEEWLPTPWEAAKKYKRLSRWRKSVGAGTHHVLWWWPDKADWKPQRKEAEML